MNQPSDGIEALARRLFDYAGLYPPASLPLEEALRRYGEHLSAEYRGMLGPFVLHAATLGALHDVPTIPKTIDFSILAGVGAVTAEFKDVLNQDLRLISDFCSIRATDPKSDFGFRIETAVPRDSFESIEPTAYLQLLASVVDHFKLNPQYTFVEVPLTASRPSLERWASAVVDVNTVSEHRFALKARCGGITADAVPSVEQVAAFLLGTAGARCPFKATAGLHHPVRAQYFTESTPMHGFINVFGAAALVYEDHIGGDDLHQLLNERDPTSFSLDDDGLRWGSYLASPTILARCRKEFALSIGSCSFSEPVRDLKAMGFLSD